jgi:hypothetical protein
MSMRRWWGLGWGVFIQVFIRACASAGHERRARKNRNNSIFTVTVRPNNIYAVEGRRSRCHPHLEVIWALSEYLFTVVLEAGGQIRPASPRSVYTLGRAYKRACTHCSNLSQYETHGLARPTRNARVSRRDRPEQQTFTLPFHFHKHAQEHAPPVYTFPIDSQHHQSIDLFPLQQLWRNRAEPKF